MSLQQRAKDFLARPVPADVRYVPDSLSERFIRQYAESDKAGLADEQAELLQICMLEAYAASEEGSPARQAYFRETAELLEAILEEQGG